MGSDIIQLETYSNFDSYTVIFAFEINQITIASDLECWLNVNTLD